MSDLLDPASKAFWRRTPQDRADEEARFYLAPIRAALNQQIESYLDALDFHDAWNGIVPAESAKSDLRSLIAEWEADCLRKEVLRG